MRLRFFMVKMELILIQLFLLCGVVVASAQASQELPAAASAPQAQSSAVPERLAGKIRGMEKTAAEISGQDDVALEKIGGRIDGDILLLPLNEDLVAVIKDRHFDWRVRYLLMLYKSYTAGDAKINKYADDFIGIMRDKSEHNRVRGMAALMLVDVSARNAAVKSALAEVAKATDTPGDVLKAVMTGVGYAGIDDADVLMRLTEREPANFNEIGINLNAVRALGKSKDPRAVGYLIKIFDESVPDSFFQVTAIQQFSPLINDPVSRARVKPLIVPRFLRLLEDRSYLGASRCEAADLLGRMKVKEAVDPIFKWFLPADSTHAKVGGGGNRMDISCGARNLVRIGDKRAIPVLEQAIANFANDSRWKWVKPEMTKKGMKYPDDHPDYKHLRKRLEELKRQK